MPTPTHHPLSLLLAYQVLVPFCFSDSSARLSTCHVPKYAKLSGGTVPLHELLPLQSFTVSQSLLKLMSMELMLSNHLILCHLLLENSLPVSYDLARVL